MRRPGSTSTTSRDVSAAVVARFWKEGDFGGGDFGRREISSAVESAPVMVRRAQDVFDVIGRAPGGRKTDCRTDTDNPVHAAVSFGHGGSRRRRDARQIGKRGAGVVDLGFRHRHEAMARSSQAVRKKIRGLSVGELKIRRLSLN